MTDLPSYIYLKAMHQRWEVTYVDAPGKLTLEEHPHKQLVVSGRRYSKRAALHEINRWVRLKASKFLRKMLEKCNEEVKVKYKRVNIRYHKLQWGSYATSQTISLNYKLVFLPRVLVKHLLYHELCHVFYLNHSDKFWNKVKKFDKNWEKNKVALVEANSYIPDWAIIW